MAAVDPIRLKPLYKLFPTLTALQITDTCLYSSGATYQDIGELRGVSRETVKRSLEAAQKRLEISSLQSLKVVFLNRFLICSFFRGQINFIENDNNMPAPPIETAWFEKFKSLFPELSVKQLTYVFLYGTGLNTSRIAELDSQTENEVRKTLDTSLRRLSVSSLHSVRLLVLNRLMSSLI